MQLKNLENTELEKYLAKLFFLERRTTSQIVDVLREISSRRLHLAQGYSSLFSYLTDHFKHPPATAQRWIDAVRLTQAEPEIQNGLVSGELNLSQISLLAKGLRENENKCESREKHNSANQVYGVPREELRELLSKIKNQGVAQTQILVAEALDLKIQSCEKKKLQKDKSIRYEITLTEDQIAVVERAKEILSHQHPNLSLAELITVMAKKLIEQKDPARTTRARRTTASETEVVNPISINMPKSVRRAIFQRDQCCQWRGAGIICGSKFQLQVDHIKPRWAGGSNEASNLQLLCATHNREKYRQESGIRLF